MKIIIYGANETGSIIATEFFEEHDVIVIDPIQKNLESFSRLDVGISLALFQLSSLVALYFGYKVFQEHNIIKKFVGTVIMLVGSTFIILG